MRIQLANYQYTGSYAKLRNAGNKSFPYSVKVEGFGTSKTKGSLFDFASVSITKKKKKDKYGTGIINGPRLHPKTSGCKKECNYSKVPQEKIDAVELPAEFDKFKERISESIGMRIQLSGCFTKISSGIPALSFPNII